MPACVKPDPHRYGSLLRMCRPRIQLKQTHPYPSFNFLATVPSPVYLAGHAVQHAFAAHPHSSSALS
jgi:hypothetical protein